MLEKIVKAIRENLPEGVPEEDVQVKFVKSYDGGVGYIMVWIDNKAVKNNV